MIIFILGGKGLLGSRIFKELQDIERHTVYSITKKNYKKFKNKTCDIFINANGNSSKFIGNTLPLKDFNQSVKVTYKSMFDFKFQKYIFLSSIDVYNENHNIINKKENIAINVKKINHYGFNKVLSESIVKHYAKKYLILRIGTVVDIKLKKNHIFDIINKNKVFVNKYTKTTLISGYAISKIISSLIKKEKYNKIYNITGKNLISYNQVSNYLKLKSNFDISKPQRIFGANVSKIEKDLNIKLNSDIFFKAYLKEIKK